MPRDKSEPPSPNSRSRDPLGAGTLKASAKARPKKTKTAAKKPRAKVAPRDWGRWLLWESAAIAVGVGMGLGISTWVLWRRAEHDVAAYLADPPRTVPGVIWSAPEDVHPGERASLAGLAGDLLAAGYDRVDAPPAHAPTGGAGVFSLQGERLSIWSTSWKGPSGRALSEGRSWVDVHEGWVAATSDPHGIRLRPTALATVGDAEGRRTPVHLADISPWVEPALLAMEDSRFRQHHGIDPIGLGRAILHDAFSSDGSQGGSTLTQQLAKNLFLSRERTAQRKIRELFFAAALEHALTKDQLLELYLSEVYLGQFGGLPLHGVEQASRAWFGVSAARLDLDQAASIAGVISAPSAYNPVKDPDAALTRRNLVLTRMVETGAISQDQADKAKDRPLILAGTLPGAIRRAPYAVDAVVDAAEADLGAGAVASEGWQVHTHLQPVLQRAAEEAVAAGIADFEKEHPELVGAQMALVAVDPRDGGVEALVGGRDYATSMYNRAVNAHRQAGSTAKPLTLLAALDAGIVTPSSRLDDAPITRHFQGTTWTPQNYDGRYLGPVTVRQAIEQSRNIPAVLLAEQLGLGRMERTMRSAGLDEATSWPSAALGSFDVTPMALAGAYTVFPGGGVVHRPQLVDALVSADGRARDIRSEGARLAGPEATAVAVHVLQGVMARGTGARASSYGANGAVAGKSGTTDNFRDAWFVGFTPSLVVAVWVGLDQGSLGLSGSKAALPTWARFVAASGTLGGRFERPAGVEEVAVCAASGLVPRAGCPDVIDGWYQSGTAPTDPCDEHEPAVVDAVDRSPGPFQRKQKDGPEH